MKIKISNANLKLDSARISEIINHYIKNSTYLYKETEKTVLEINDWLANKQKKQMTIITSKNEQDQLLGFAYFDEFRAQTGYKLTIESSVYVAPDFLKQGIGETLLNNLILSAQKKGFHCAIAVIDSENKPSLNLHYKVGFIKSGILKQAGIKFKKFRDVVFMQKIMF